MGKVEWSNEAREDLEEFFLETRKDLEEFFLQQCKFSEKFTQKWADDIFEVIYLLENNPRLGRVVPELQANSIREMIIEKYRLLYQISKDDDIEIITIRHTARPLNY
ncbi:MAG: type II toxin-antitoxin system RelE/ParE family toxin [Arcicella sp.]|nr:type II toxin-antitoxin system RelE/ParE family toxin [Arcicella sp.]